MKAFIVECGEYNAEITPRNFSRDYIYNIISYAYRVNKSSDEILLRRNDIDYALILNFNFENDQGKKKFNLAKALTSANIEFDKSSFGVSINQFSKEEVPIPEELLNCLCPLIDLYVEMYEGF